MGRVLCRNRASDGERLLILREQEEATDYYRKGDENFDRSADGLEKHVTDSAISVS
jgi:hypothetical protein